MSADIFDDHSWVGVVYWHIQCRGKDVANYPAMHSPSQKIILPKILTRLRNPALEYTDQGRKLILFFTISPASRTVPDT